MFSAAFRARTSLIRKYLHRYRKLVGFGMVMLVLVDLLEILPPLILKSAIDSIVEKSPYVDVAKFAAGYVFVLFVQGFCRWGWRIFLVRASHLAGRDLRADFANHLFGMSAGFYDKNRVGDLMSRANSDVESVRQFMGPGILIFADAIFYLATVPIVMFWLSPTLTGISLIPILAIPYIVWKLEGAVHARYKSAQDQFSDVSAMAQENLNGIRVVKAFARETHQYDRFRKLGEEYVRRNLKLSRVQSSFGPLMDFFASLGIVLLLWFGGRFVIEDAVTLGTFVAFQRYIQKMVWPMMALGLAASSYQRALASSTRLNEIFSQSSPILPPSDPRRSEGGMRGGIEIRNLNFSFPDDPEHRLVLRNLSLTIEPGMRCAFLGRIGSGKSALFSLLPRLYPAPVGTIWIDGIPVEEWDLEELRSQIGFVSQDVFLFSDPVEDNIGFGKLPPTSESREELITASARIAAVDDEIRGLPLGYRTLLGERGVNLSGGQKQRISLARALATNPAILMLDDALSAVDVRTEEKILSALRSRPRRPTELVAAHRISTVQQADRIFVLEKGELVEEGKHSELIRRPSGIYAKFYEEQRLKEDLESYMRQVDAKLGLESGSAGE